MHENGSILFFLSQIKLKIRLCKHTMDHHTRTKQSIANKSNNLDQYYEYRVYDKHIGNSYRGEMYSMSEYAPCPIVVMSRHQGFQWNEELFVSAYRRSAGYECHKSTSLRNRDQKINHSTNKQHQEQQSSSDDSTTGTTDVIEINLTDEDCDVWP